MSNSKNKTTCAWQGGLLLLAALGLPAAADDEPGFHPYVGLGYTHDDNLLRLPDGASLDGQRSDALRQAIAGILFRHGYGRQQVELDAKATDVRFAHFTALDYRGKDARARWGWVLGHDLDGTLEAAYHQTLAPYTDFHSNERNLRTEQRQFFEARWTVVPSWRLRAALQHDRFEYDLASQRFNDRTEKLAEAGIDYLARSGNYAGLVLRRLEGSFPHQRVVGSVVDDQDFTQDEVKARLNWRSSGITTVDVLAGWARRRYARYAERDASGANGRATVTWAPHGKTTLTAAAWREFTALESAVVTYSLNKGVSLDAKYAASGKTTLQAATSYERRAYNARTGGAGLDLSDTLRTSSVGVSYAATRTIALSLQAYRQRRSGSNALGLGSFHATGVSFSASAQF
jgi:exopolysaccharide biosynthesis operon protein EpsL